MQVVGKNKNLIKERKKKILFSTSIRKLTVEEDTEAYKEMKQISHQGIVEILGPIETGKMSKTFEFQQLQRLDLHSKCLIGGKTTKHSLNNTK